MGKKENTIQTSLKIPESIFDKILEIKNSTKDNTTKIIVSILAEHFGIIEDQNRRILKDLENLFSLGEMIFMPKRVYKQLLQKSEELINNEIERSIIKLINIAGIDFIIMESAIDVNAITIEHIIQKKEIVALKRKVEELEKRLPIAE